MLTTFSTYRVYTRDLDHWLQNKSKEPQVAHEIDYFNKTIGSITSIDEFIGDSRVLTFAMNAFGLADMAYARAYVRKVLEEGVDSPDSFANRIADDRFRKFAQTFNFKELGAETTKSEAVRSAIVQAYVRQTFEVDAGLDNEGVRLALYFMREAPKVSSAYGLLGDAALWQVTKTVFGFPDGMANADIDRQAEAVMARLDMTDLRDPAKLDQLVRRFTLVWDATQTATQDPILALFTSPEQSTTADVFFSLGTLKHGGL